MRKNPYRRLLGRVQMLLARRAAPIKG